MTVQNDFVPPLVPPYCLKRSEYIQSETKKAPRPSRKNRDRTRCFRFISSKGYLRVVTSSFGTQGILNECTIFVPEIHENYAFNANKPSTRVSEQRTFLLPDMQTFARVDQAVD
jgi:hypothetical protein